jgi:diguanylate cyclase (GGDEF)-like protein
MATVPATQDRAIAAFGERRLALVVACAGILLAGAAVLWGSRFSSVAAALPPALVSAAVVTMMVTAAIMRYFYRASNFPPHAFLGIAFACTGGLLVPYVFAILELASSPNAPAATGQLATWLWVGWHTVFIVLLGIYVWSEGFFTHRSLPCDRERKIVRTFAAGAVVIATVGVVLLLTCAQWLPTLQSASGTFTPTYRVIVQQIMLALCAGVCVMLIFRTGLNKTVHLWLAVVLVLFACEMFINGKVVQRSSVGWYIGLAEGLAWQSVLLVVLLRRANEQLVEFVSSNRSLSEATVRDALTGLLNRRGFDERFQEALADARMMRAPLALLALDLDNFKSYNDYFGHVAGDKALQAVAQAISGVTTRTRDVACRVGGEEFALVLPFTEESGAMTVAERVRAAVLQLRLAHAPDAALAILSVSIGVAVSDGTVDGTELYHRADQALYRAKRLGRNRIARHTPAPEAGVTTLRAV